MKVLLSSVFGPYGVDDEYGQASCRMELFHNQVTREQGVFSIRMFHPTFGLHFLAANISAATTVLDFPSEARFVEELRNDYDVVGISFIVPNFERAKRMAKLVRRHAPRAKIVLGGHGTPLPEVDEIPNDGVCRGEGVRWLRSFLGEDPERPITHPILSDSFGGRILGVPVVDHSGHLTPGLGCPNACFFCLTSSFFDHKYIPYLTTGREMFDVCEAVERTLGYRKFYVMDENFLAHPERAYELADLIARNGKNYRFSLFSSAENIKKVGVDFLVRLGVISVWLGVESNLKTFPKNRGVDFASLVRELRDHGILVLTSAILFLEEHDRANIWEDIRETVALEPDLIQFMQLGPAPNTPVYRRFRASGRLIEDVPYAEWHGQGQIWFRHPHFSREESGRILTDAFRYDYDTLGPSLVRMAETVVRGFQNINGSRDPLIVRRRESLRRRAEKFRPFLAAARHHAHNDNARALIERVRATYDEAFGPMSLKQRAQGQVVRAYAAQEARRVAAGRNNYQPPTIVTRYRT
ncbi:MAG: radical SAM protein [Holophagae bacterium]|nr:MAG: radical SAM protein [Holophagae bacterium]